MNSERVIQSRILKIATCPSLSGRASIAYHLGFCDEREVCFRIWKTSGKGVYSKEWVSAAAIQSVLGEHDSIVAPMLLPIFNVGRSVNTAGFLLAALKSEGLVALSPDKPHQYIKQPSDAFVSETSALINAGVSLNAIADAPAMPKLPRKRSGGRAVVPAWESEAQTD